MYDWGYSNAYIELMCTDTTIYDYSKLKSKDKSRVKKSDVDEAMRVYNERKKAIPNMDGFTPIKLSEQIK